jgi:hypothetical protein
MAEDIWVSMENPPKSPLGRGTLTKVFGEFGEIVGVIGKNPKFS